MKTIIYKGTKTHPESFRLAPHPRLTKGVAVQVEDDVAAALVKCAGVEAVAAKKSDKKGES